MTGVAGFDEDDGMCAGTLRTAFETEVFGGSGLDRYAVEVHIQYVGNGLAHLLDVGSHLGALSHNDAVDIAHSVAFLL